MTATPRKLVHWALDVSLSQFGSPYSDASSDSVISTSSLQYINSQLVAHGFAPSPGLSLDGLSNADMERVVKCLLGMLSQRVEDMSRAEDLTTKLRTLSYDHERLITMHRAATEKAANAEREMNLHKSRLASSTRTLNTTLSEHKQTSLSLSRTRQTLFALRQSHISELKKKEKEIEKMVDKWSRVADAQVRLGAVGSGWVNSGVVDAVEGVDVDVDGKGEGFLEVALEQAEKARSDLLDENGRLRKWVVGAVNDVQAVLHLARSILVSENQEEPTAYTQTTLFPLHPPAPTAANEKLTGLLTSLRESIMALSLLATERPAATGVNVDAKSKTADGEVERLQGIVDTLRVEIENAHKQSAAHAAQTQALFDGLQTQTQAQAQPREVGDVSVDLMITPIKDEEKNRIEATKKELEEERRKFTEAAVRLGREKAALETERIQFLDEKRSWQVEQMLAELPPTPFPTSSAGITSQADPTTTTSPSRLKPSSIPIPNDSHQHHPVFRKSQHQHKSPSRKSPRKSPGKPTVIVGGALGSRKTQRVLRRSSGFGLGERVEPSFETEVIPSAFPITAAANTKPGSGRLSQSLLPTSFVLPPPSPHSSLPRVPALLSSVTAALPALKLPALKLAAAPGTNVDVETYPTTSTTTAQKASSPDSPHAMTNTDPNLITPPSIRRPFPMAKPYASKMVHAYSPARPSPLSRILMLNEDSLAEPLTSSPSSMDDLVEEEEEESPLKEKKVEVNVNPKKTHGTDSDGDAKRFTTKEKGKSRAVVGSVQVSLQKSRTVEKENQVKMKSVRGSSGSSSSSSGSGSGSSGLGKMKPAVDGKKAVKPASSAATASSTRVGMKLPPGKGGARRVPIDSAEAAPIGPGWRK